MTYCLAMRLNEGLLFLADTRTNAGLDNVSTFRKLHVFRPAPDRVFVLESAGNLATTQETLDRINRDLRTPGDSMTLATAPDLFEVALYIGRISRDVVKEHEEALAGVGADGTCSFILGGQIGDAKADILQIYPEGNYIRASDDRPFLQIGESKYGKFLLELGAAAHVGMEEAVKVALTSMMSTARANLSVGPPYDLALYQEGSFEVGEIRIEGDAEFLHTALESWERHLLSAIHELPPLPFGAG
jgi:putative proteasome-type protease